ncbi:MAG TPA: hypothetical protein VF278_24050 [Pirellulales bacterium]
MAELSARFQLELTPTSSSPAPMPYRELAILLPCHSLEDFPVYQEGPEAEGLLAAWSALWHPALLASAERLPTWYRADGPPDEVAERLFVVPAPSEPLLVAGWTSRAHDAGACVVRKTQARAEIVAAALAKLPDAPPVDADLAADFLALGLCFLLVELLTRQMRYMSNIDEIHLRNLAIAAATAACEGRADEAREKLRNCFEVLAEARERFYPVEAYLIDLVLTAPTTLGPSLRGELDNPVPKNLLISGELAERLAAEQPDTLLALREALAQNRLSLVGGEYTELELPLLPMEAIRRELARGLAAYEQAFNTRPTVYGRRRFGLTPLLPAVLSSAGFSGALHFTLDDGHFPQGGQSKMRWEGVDASAIDALGRLPLDASKAESVLSYSRKMGETMDMDHVATLVFAHWPGQINPFFADLRRMASYAPALGKFVTLDEFFEKTDRPGDVNKFRADQYRAPYLRQAIIREESDPLSRLADEHLAQLRAQSAQTMTALASLLSGTPIAAEQPGPPSQCTVDEAAAALAERLTGQPVGESTVGRAAGPSETQDGPAGRPTLALNPHSFALRQAIETPGSASGTSARVIVEIPPLGFAALPVARPTAPTAKTKSKPNDKELAINNEFVQVVVSRQTGGIRSIYDVGQRGNLLSQQLAFRLPPPKPKPGDVWRDPDADSSYSNMLADEVRLSAGGPAYNEVTSIGRLVDPEGSRIAGFTQRVGLARGSRVVLLEIELDTDLPPRADPWNSYYACRFAWGDEAAELRRSVGLTSQFTDARNLEAPYFIEIRAAKARVTLLTGGWPYHRRVGDRMLDTLLVVRGESRRRFTLGIGAGISHPAADALSLLSPASLVACQAAPKSPSGWLFHIDAKNVVTTHWEAVEQDGRVVGFRARLWETEGKGGPVRLRSFKAAASARQVDFFGQTIGNVTLEGDTIVAQFTPYELIEIEAKW